MEPGQMAKNPGRLALCRSSIMRFNGNIPGGKKVVDRSAILACGSPSAEPRQPGEATLIPKVDKARVQNQGATE
jgi:hypothetical protein